MAGKPKSTAHLFIERMDREGRGEDFRAAVKRLMADGLPYISARPKAMKEFGYEGPKVERALAAKMEAEQAQAEQQRKQEERWQMQREFGVEVREKRKALDFEEAMVGLPPVAPPDVELAWVRAHPGMTRLARMTDKTKQVDITGDDVRRPPHGPAPSAAAVAQLVHFANHPTEFYKQILQEHKKSGTGEGDVQGRAADPTLGEVRRYLDQLNNREVSDADDVESGAEVGGGRED